MSKLIFVSIAFAVISVSAVAARVETSKLRQLADIKINTYNHQLRTTLQSNIELGTLKRNIKGCESTAQNMLVQNGTGGWELERTSLKFRNPDNAPDAWEKRQLEVFQTSLDNGKSIDKLSIERLTSVGPKKVAYKYMKAIKAEAICLNCHGTEMTDTVKSNLNKAYPNDLAIGYKEGDLMGAFVLKKMINTQ